MGAEDAGHGGLSRRAALGGVLAAGAVAAVATSGAVATAAPADGGAGTSANGGANGTLYPIRKGKQSAVIAGVAATLLSWRVNGEEVLFPKPERAFAETGYAGKTLLPWCNRIEAGKYRFGGHDYQVPINEPSHNSALHGLLNFVEWELVRHTPTSVRLRYVAPVQYGYPFSLVHEIEYTVDDHGVRCTLSARNTGEQRAPYTTATHIYIAAPPGGRINDITLTLPARQYYTVDKNLIPTGKKPVAGSPYDFRTARKIGGTKMDTCFTDVRLGAGQESVATLRRPGSVSVELWMDAKHNYYQLYSDDSPAVDRPTRQGLAIEPMIGAPNAFNTRDGLVVIEPGRRFTSSWGLRSI